MADFELFVERNYSNLLDYICDYGDDSFSKRPFCDADNLVFSALVYVVFEDVVPVDFKPLTLSSLARNYLGAIDLRKVNKEYPDFQKKGLFLAMSLLKRRRYAKCIVQNFISIFDEIENTQFAALDIQLNEKTSVVAYRGTDNSILGWLEDAHFACYDEVKGQALAKQFLMEAMQKRATQEFYVVGHSKGGNLALFAAASLSEDEQKRIVRVYSNDGPGLRKAKFESQAYQNIADRVSLILVEDDIVGGLLYNPENYTIVKSSPANDFFSQHDIYHWQLNGDKLVQASSLTPGSIYISKCIRRWLEEGLREEKERILFVDAIFSILNRLQIKKTDQIIDNMHSFLRQFFHEINKRENEEEKKRLRKALWSLISIFTAEHQNYLNEKNKWERENRKASKGGGK